VARKTTWECSLLVCFITLGAGRSSEQPSPPPMAWETGGPLVGVGEKGVGLPAVELAGVLLQLALDADRGTSNHKASGQRRDTGDGGVDAR